MHWVAHRPAQIGKTNVAKPLQRIVRRRFGDRRLDLGMKPPLRLFCRRVHQRIAARKMPERRPRRDAGPARGLADADGIWPALADQLQRRIDQHAPEVAMVIGLLGRAAGRRAEGPWSGIWQANAFELVGIALVLHHPNVNVSIDYTD